MKGIDIIIPVYNAYLDLTRCLDSIIKYTDLKLNYLLLLNDKSTDERILPYIQKFSEKSKHIIVIDNEKNLGFSENINQGIRFSQRDVIFLNSDTIVTPCWIEKIQKCAYLRDNIATVTPLSNNATIFSVPDFCQENKIPSGYNIETFSALVEKCSLKKYPVVPVAHGFCMYVKREAIKKVGLLDSATFGRGYGEENDFCWRATQLGYIHVMCDDTFIYHNGTASFLSEEKKKYIEEHQAILEERYPRETRETSLFCQKNPYDEIQKNIQIQMMMSNGKRNILYMLQSDFRSDAADNIGGVQLHVKDLVNNLRDRYNIFVAAPNKEYLNFTGYFNDREVAFQFYIGAHKPPYCFRDNDLNELYVMLLKTFQINLIHVHHVLGVSMEIFYAGNNLGLPIVTTLHDYYYLCPNVKMINYKNELCIDKRTPEMCRTCLNNRFAINEHINFIHAWQSECEKILAMSERLIVPSSSAEKLYVQYYPELKNKMQVVEHGLNPIKFQEENSIKEKTQLHIAFIGGLSIEKGAKYAYDLIINGSYEIQWCIFGNIGYEPLESLEKDNLVKTGLYRREDLGELLKEHDIDIVCILPIWPETYCYTLSEALECGVPVIGSDIGAIGERIKKLKCGWLVPAETNYRLILDKIDDIKNNPKEYAIIKRNVQNLRLKGIDEMIEEYTGVYEEFAVDQCIDTSSILMQFWKSYEIVNKGIVISQKEQEIKIREFQKEIYRLNYYHELKDAGIAERDHWLVKKDEMVAEKNKYIEELNAYIRVLEGRENKFKCYFNLLSDWMTTEESGEEIYRKILNLGYSSIAIYGFGKIGKHLFEKLKNSGVDVRYIIDRNNKIDNSNLKIFHPGDTLPEVDAIIVTPVVMFDEILQTLKEKIECPILPISAII